MARLTPADDDDVGCRKLTPAVNRVSDTGSHAGLVTLAVTGAQPEGYGNLNAAAIVTSA